MRRDGRKFSSGFVDGCGLWGKLVLNGMVGMGLEMVICKGNGKRS